MIQGSLRTRLFPEVLLEVYASARTGLLHVTRGEIRKRIFIRMGMPFFASSSDPSDRMGEMLMRQGKLQSDQLRDVLTLAEAQSKKLGTVLVELGILTPEGLIQAVVDQAEGIVHSLFLWDEGDYLFEEGEPKGDDILPLDLSAANLIVSGVRRMYTPDRMKRVLGSPRRILAPTQNPAYRFQEVRLTDEEARVLPLADGTRTVAEILAAAGEPTIAALRLLTSLLLLKTLEVQGEAQGVPRPPPLSPEEARALVERAARELPAQDFYQRLRLPRSVPSESIRGAVELRAVEFSPDRFQGPDFLDLQESLQAIRRGIEEAGRTLADAEARRRYDAELERRSLVSLVDETYNPGEARREYDRGVAHMQQKRPKEALEAFQKAVRMDSRNAEYLTALGRLFGSSIDGKDPDLEKAERCFRKAIELSPKDARNYFYLGHIYRAKEDPELAVRCFKKTLELAPGHPGAQKELSELKAAGR